MENIFNNKSLNEVKLNMGCGSVRPHGWINTDSSINANLQKLPVFGKALARQFNKVEYHDTNMVYMNLNKKWKYKNDSVDVVYGSHLFEHLSLKSADLFLKEAYRCLKPGGIIRLVVPDLYKICKKYVNEYEKGNENAAEFILWAINMHRDGQYGSDLGILKKTVLEMQGYPHQHKFMYDKYSLTNKIRLVGFTDIIEKEYGISDYISSLKDVEGTSESYLSVYIEAKK